MNLLIKEKKLILLTIVVAFASFLTSIFIANKISVLITERKVFNTTQATQQALTNELAYALEQSRQMAESGVFNRLIEQNDVVGILALQSEEVERRQIDVIVAVNKEGIALSQVPLIYNRGDYAALTSPWGRSAAQGMPMATIGAGKNFPLIIVGAYPIVKDGKVVGAIHSGFYPNDKYSLRFQEKYLAAGTRIAFYAREEGIVGSSFQDESIKKLLLLYFNQGTQWIIGGYSNELININGNEYFIKNIVFPDGGALIFIPYSSSQQNIIISLITALVFVLFSIFLLRRPPQETRSERRRILVLIGIIGVGIFIGSFVFNRARFERKIVPIQRPPYTIYNSTLRFKPEQNVIAAHTEQKIVIQINTGGEAINAAQVVVHYDPAVARVEQILTANSFCPQEFFLEKEIDNDKGEVRVVCMVPTPGLTTDQGIVAELLIQMLKAGELTLRFGEETEVLANDGLGTDVLRMVTNAAYQVTEFNSKELIIFSPTHPNSERWYNKKEATFSWPVQEGGSFLYSLDKIPDTAVTSSNGKVTTANTVMLQVSEEGVYYFHVAVSKGASAGPTSHFKIKVDTTPPAPPAIRTSATKIKAGEVVRFEFGGKDTISGLQAGYYVKVDNGILLPSLPQLYMAFPESGTHTLTVRVFDNANNFNESTIQINAE